MECCLVLFLEFLIDHSGDGKVATNWTWGYMQRVKNYFNPIQDGSFQGCWRMGVGKSLPVPKICRTMIKLGTVLALLKKIQKIYKSCGTPFVHCWRQHFFTGNHQLSLHRYIKKCRYRLPFNSLKVFLIKLGCNFDDTSKIGYSRPS